MPDITEAPLLTQEAEDWPGCAKELHGYLIDIADELCCESREGKDIAAAVRRLVEAHDRALIELIHTKLSGSQGQGT
jgi:hypothetical protein